ncbi:hypothetical protein TGAM01_v201447 [Trichoderma gamsii]|uniref:Uncharacterized protein n=1 Tax=Trichoderma gamsii TaxID=398673 RepID=A0A2P5A0L4_9HYPO|nr:hypothetical protein TGAM01_v201447 [Trichoderma gamsii]PON30080.1 hypothetical protein TGAM01_v201447 [Trichoderma gamsii]
MYGEEEFPRRVYRMEELYFMGAPVPQYAYASQVPKMGVSHVLGHILLVRCSAQKDY